MSQIGSNVGMVSQSVAQSVDGQGNPIVSSDTFFGVSPAGPALLSQQLFGIANATFELLPPSPTTAISSDNQIPYWDWIEYSDGVISATPSFDSATSTWGITITPGSAITNDYAIFRTRSYVLTDDNLNLRQNALTIISKSGTAGGTAAQWQLALGATYFDATGGTVSSYSIGTVTDVTTWTSLSGTTTAGGSAIGASARYVDLTYTLTALGTVTGSAAVTIKSALLSSSIGSRSFIVTETFTSSATWTVPTGVTTLLAIVGLAAGGGGAGGSYKAGGVCVVGGSGGGGGGRWSILRDVSLGTATSLSIGIGAGGAAGTARVGTAAIAQSLTGGQGGTGASTTVGTILTATGGGGGTAVAPTATSPVLGGGGGIVAPSSTSTTYGLAQVAGTAGASGGSAFTSSASAGSVGNSIATADQLSYPYTPTFTNLGTAGGSASVGNWGDGANARSTIGVPGTAGTVSFWGAGGGGGGGAYANDATQLRGAGAGGNGATYGAGGAGGAAAGAWATNLTGGGTVIGGAGGAAGASTGSGGGGGGGIAVSASGTAIKVNTSGAGGAGAAGFVALVYIG